MAPANRSDGSMRSGAGPKCSAGGSTCIHCAVQGFCDWTPPGTTTAAEAAAAGTKPTNPKDVIGSDKLPLHLWPETATAMGCLAFMEGVCKYGLGNFRVVGVRASIYLDALMRHLSAYVSGEDIDPDSGIPHLGKMLACIAIIIDAQAVGKLTDDRTVDSGFTELCKTLTPIVLQIKARHADKSPKHYFHVNETETL